MNINVKFALQQEVRITPLEREGVVKSIWITEMGIKYEVRYFDHAEAKTVYFYDNELKALDK